MKLHITPNGLSQQSDALRRPGTVSDCLNIEFNPVSGVSPRSGTKRLVPENYEGTEQVVSPNVPFETSDGRLWVIRSHGIQLTLTSLDDPTISPHIVADLSGYLSSTTKAEDLRLLMTWDSLLVLNTKKTVETQPDLDDMLRGHISQGLVYFPPFGSEVRVFVNVKVIARKAAGPEWGTAGHSENQLLSEFIADTGTISPGSSASDWVTDVGWVLFNGPHTRANYGGNVVGVQAVGSRVYHDGAVWKATSTHKFDDSLAPGTAGAQWELDYLTQGGQPATVPEWTTDGDALYYSDADAQEFEFEVIMTKGSGEYDYRVFSSSRSPKGDRYVAVGANSFEQLPPYLPNETWATRMVFEIAPGYYYRFVPSSNKWLETTAPNEDVSLDPSTMPHEITYDAESGTWESLEIVPEFGKFRRRVGSAEVGTNPDPEFVGRTISDMTLWRGRLCFSSDNTLSCSSTNSPFLWWADTGREILDSDPISVRPSTGTYSQILWLVPSPGNTLMLVGNSTQSIAHSGQDFLTPRSIQLQDISALRVIPHVRPQVVEDTLVYVSPSPEDDNYCVLREYSIQSLLSGAGGGIRIRPGADLNVETPRLIHRDKILSFNYDPVQRSYFVLMEDGVVAKLLLVRNNDGDTQFMSWTVDQYPMDVVSVVAGVLVSNTGKTLQSKGTPLGLDDAHVSTSPTVPEGYISVNPETNQHQDPDGSSERLFGKPFVSYLELPRVYMRNQDGSPRHDYSGIVENLEVDVSKGSFKAIQFGHGLPTRQNTCFEYPDGRALRVLSMYPMSRLQVRLEPVDHIGFQLVGMSYNVDVTREP